MKISEKTPWVCRKLLLFIILITGMSLSGQTLDNQDNADTGLGQGETLPIPFVDLAVRAPTTNQETSLSLQLLLLLTVLSLAPSLIILLTSFLRISVVLNFVRQALSLQQAPPNAVLMGIALFLTLFVMFPTFNTVYREAFVPFSDGDITMTELYDNALPPLRLFMYRQMAGDNNNINLFMNLSGLPRPQTFADVPTYVLIPAFVLHELTVAFRIGVYIYVPFIIIDLLVASILMSMGMIMLPPVMISMPFKLVLFLLVDGWTLLIRQMVLGFR